MLSKIKASSLMETRRSIGQTSENEEELDNDTNNNNSNSIDNNQHTKMTQDELLDIVEVSKKQRLSKDDADSLSNFIRWSFDHVDLATKQQNEDKCKSKATLSDDELLDDEMNDESDDWSALERQRQDFETKRYQQATEQLRHQAKLSAGGSSATNLALMRASGERFSGLGSMLTENGRLNKRPRTQVYSPEAKYNPSNVVGNSSSRKSSSYLGNVVERLHQQQQQQQQQHQQQQQQQQVVDNQQDAEPETSSNPTLSFHLQQFLQQQTSLEDLCSSVGIDDSNQLVLAAAIHRALVDSVGPNQLGGPVDTKSTASSTGSSSGGSLNIHNNNNSNNNNNNNNTATNLSQMSALNSTSNLQLVDTLTRQRTAYNTRAALHGLQTAGNRQSGAMNMSNRVQQQRHAQAAAALSALGNTGGQHQLSSSTPLVDFECDTCGSSFDDRHRLMQHQSIHLELKKDWFTETPVDEVMKIFNRRRGEFLCNTCNLRFEATFDYDKHNHSVHGQRPYCCQFCGNGTRTFRFWRQYLNHLYDHRYIFSCTIDDCDFTVNRRDSLRFHIFRFHLNCQLPQNQQQMRSNHGMMLGDSKWSTMDEDNDNDNVMSLGE